MYDETGPDGKRRYTVAQIATESASPAHHLPPPQPPANAAKHASTR